MMGRNRFVASDTVRLEISDGDWVEVKSRLSYGEQQRLAGAAIGKMALSQIGASDMETGLDLERYNILRLETWLTDWSFVGPNGKQVPVTRDAIRNLDPDTAGEIDAVLTAHIQKAEDSKNAMKPAT